MIVTTGVYGRGVHVHVLWLSGEGTAREFWCGGTQFSGGKLITCYFEIRCRLRFLLSLVGGRFGDLFRPQSRQQCE